MRAFILSCAVLLGTGAAIAETYTVRPDGTGDFPTIQAAVDAAVHGDIIEMTDGTFTGEGNRDVTYNGKGIIIRSQNFDPEFCIIDCEREGRGFDFPAEQAGVLSVLEGVTIINGDGSGGGGGVRIGPYGLDGFPVVRNCIFDNNEAHVAGGVYAWWGSPLIEGCLFTNNRATADNGGGFASSETTAMVRNCTFVGNTAVTTGGGLSSVHGPSYVQVENCVFVGNVGEAASCRAGGHLSLVCCDLYNNVGGDWVGCVAEMFGVDGNISEDPLFCDPEHGDFSLQAGSPCAPFTPPNEECDLIGALPVGCGGSTPVSESTWGGIKAIFGR